MSRVVARLRRSRSREAAHPPVEGAGEAGEACSWEALRDVYREQAARGVPEAIRGLELIEQDRWPSSGRSRRR